MMKTGCAGFSRSLSLSLSLSSSLSSSSSSRCYSSSGSCSSGAAEVVAGFEDRRRRTSMEGNVVDGNGGDDEAVYMKKGTHKQSKQTFASDLLERLPCSFAIQRSPEPRLSFLRERGAGTGKTHQKCD